MDIMCPKCGRRFPEGTDKHIIEAHAEMHNRQIPNSNANKNPPKKIPNIFDPTRVIFPQFENPSLLMVKMLLSEIRVWVKEYDIDNYNCVSFSKEVVGQMTDRQVRCGYTVINFNKGDSHAIIAFETDYGLIFIEPQTGEQVDVMAGRRYCGNSQGVPDEPIITDFEITWNCL